MNKWKILTPILVVALLAFSFWYGGDAPDSQGWSIDSTAEDVVSEPVSEAPITSQTQQEQPEENLEENLEPEPELEPEIEQEPELELELELELEPEIQPEITETPPPVDSQDAEITDNELTVTLSVRCDTILDNLDWLTAGKESLVPADGVIFPATEVVFFEGESVFNVLLREMKIAGIHMEYENTPLYNSAYIEGIGNLYEYDCGQLSGWLYSVNSWFPNYGCSRYSLQDGDVVELVYSCDLGADVGGADAAGGQYEG